MKVAILLTAVAVFAVAIFVVACSKSKNETPSNPSSEKFVDVDDEDNDTTIHVLPGETIRVKLRSNPSTGFSWALGPFEERGLETNGESEFVADPHSEGEAGYGGCEIWTFKARHSGKTEISLFYARSWEDIDPAKRFKLNVVIGDASSQIATGDEIDLTENDNGKNIEVHTGDVIRIVLESNITTGYSWENADKVDKDILALDSDDYVSDPNPEEMDGVGGNTVIVYRALKPGKTKVELVYSQSWEPSEFDQRFSVTVEVSDRP